MNYFENIATLDEAKQRFWDLAKIHHPDKGGETATFQEILNQFHAFDPEKEKFAGEREQWNSAEYVSIIDELIRIPEITIEICGSWIWVSGNTKPYKDQIKAVNCGESYKWGFSKQKLMWYFSPKSYRKFSKQEFTINQIRNLYGSTKVEKNERKQISA